MPASTAFKILLREFEEAFVGAFFTDLFDFTSPAGFVWEFLIAFDEYGRDFALTLLERETVEIEDIKTESRDLGRKAKGRIGAPGQQLIS